MQLECMGGPLDGEVLVIPDDQTGFIADPLVAGAPRSHYVVERGLDLNAWTGAVTSHDRLVFDDWVSD